MKTRRHADAEAVYAALDTLRETSLRGLRSSFLPPDDPMVDRVWTLEAANELLQRFVGSPDVSKRTFIEKLTDQLASASPEAGQLFEELAWLHVVVAARDKFGYAGKRRLLNEIAAITDAGGPHGVFDDALTTGLASPGTAFFTFRPNQLSLLVRFAVAWTSATDAERAGWLDDASSFRELVYSLEGIADQTQRNALLHLVHPVRFEEIVSQQHKRDIAKLAKPEEIADNDDETIARVRQHLAKDHGADFSFYDDEIRDSWQPELVSEPAAETAAIDDVIPSEASAPIAALRNAWLIRASGGEKVPAWLDQGICSVFYADSFPFEVPPGVTREQLRSLADDAGVDTSAGSFSMELSQLWRFVNMVEIGDYVLTVDGTGVYIGVVESSARDRKARTRIETVRSVEWLNAEQPIARRSVAPTLQSKMKTLLTVSSITSEIDELERWVDGSSWEQPSSPPARPHTLLPQSTAELAGRVLMPEAWLAEVIDMLEQKKQLVLYGPPGTGKTFLAQEFAEHVTRGGGASELIQFHPSYTYEDFFEGYRPGSDLSGGVEFRIKPGPLRRIAEAAAAAPDSPHVLIIDEINRANLAKVFGELYFLLEYRDRPIVLQYSDTEFTLPPNLYVIGTMNTADRSIALVDAAMRRRFYFVELSPASEPVNTMLKRWLQSKGLDDTPARLLTELNRRLADSEAAIGPSYFMTTDIMSDGQLERIWRHAILPLLEERYFGADRDLSEFSLDKIRKAIAPSDAD